MRVCKNKFENGVYPSVDGIPVSPSEIWTPETRLNLNKHKNFTNHHNCWTERAFGKFALYKTLRNLTSQQFLLPKDVHGYIHLTYSPPKLPTPLQALEEIKRAATSRERLYYRKSCRYIYEDIGDEVMKQVLENYDELQKRRNKLSNGVYNKLRERRDRWDNETLSLIPDNMYPVFDWPEVL